jgi:6-phospho-3-hexuloisomerase
MTRTPDAEASFAEIRGAILGEVSACLAQAGEEDAGRAIGLVEGARRIFCAGAGRSGLAVRGFAMRLMHLGREVHVAGETTAPAIRAGDLLLIGSGSGRTASLLAAARAAREAGARILLVTIDPASPIAELADGVVALPAPSEKAAGGGARQSVQPMGTLFEQAMALFFDALVVLLMRRAGADSEAMFVRHANLE